MAIRNIVAFYAPGTAKQQTKNFSKVIDKNGKVFDFGLEDEERPGQPKKFEDEKQNLWESLKQPFQNV